MRVLVTGANGFIGKVLIKKLLDRHFEVCVLSRSKDCCQEGVTAICGDLLIDDDRLLKAVTNCDVIFHCAGELFDEQVMFDLHVTGTKNLLNAVSRSMREDRKAKHWIQLSSVGVYGPPVNPNASRIVSEDTCLNPLGSYEVSKKLSDDLIINLANDLGITFSILRPSNVVGLSMRNQSFAALLSAIERRHFFYIGTKKSIATYIHVDDLVNAMILCAVDDRAINQVFNLSNDCRLADIVSAINIANQKDDFVCIPEALVRLIVGVASLFKFSLLTRARVDALVSKTTYSSAKIKDCLGVSFEYQIPDFALQYMNYLNRNKL